MLSLGIAAARADDDPALAQARAKFETAEALLKTTLKETSAGLEKAKAAALQKKEAAWEEFRDARSAALARTSAGGQLEKPKLSAAYWEAMATYTQMRVDFLRLYTGKTASKGITGEYKDAYDGDLEVEETKEGINFTLSVVRGNAALPGQISGAAVKKGDTARFKQQFEPGQKGKPCELVFTFSEGHIAKIEEVSPDPDVEAGVHYDGEYYKTSDPVIP